MADETIKYSKTDPDGTTTTDVFENFEPWHYGEPAIPDNLYFLGTDEKAKGYQQYFDNNGYGIQEINVANFKINDKPIRGCKKGTVVTAKELTNGQRNIEIWFNKNKGKVYYKFIGDSDDKAIELKDGNGIVPKRLGIALVGGGGACGDCKTEKWKNKCHTFDTTMPGGGGGGGGIIWGIINLDETGVYTIKVGTGGWTKGASGEDTTLSKDGKTLAIAGGGGGGGTGKKSGAAGGVGGACTFSTDKTYFIKCGQKEGEQGGSYSELDVNNEGQYIGSSVEANKFEIEFVPGSSKLVAGSDKHDGVGDTIENIAEAAGHVYFAVPGGNSFENGGYPMGDDSLVAPTWGGGGMSWTYNDNNPENIWADNTNSFKANSTTARCGAKGGWILFY